MPRGSFTLKPRARSLRTGRQVWNIILALSKSSHLPSVKTVLHASQAPGTPLHFPLVPFTTRADAFIRGNVWPTYKNVSRPAGLAVRDAKKSLGDARVLRTCRIGGPTCNKNVSRHAALAARDVKKTLGDARLRPTCRIGGPTCKKSEPTCSVGGARCKKALGDARLRPTCSIGSPRCKNLLPGTYNEIVKYIVNGPADW